MKIRKILPAILALTVLTACGAEKSQPIITGSAPLVLEAAGTGFAASQSLKDYAAPETFTGDWEGLEGCYIVHADAAVQLPDSDAMPIASVERRSFTQSDADMLLDAFIGENEFYEEVGMAKAEIGERLERYRAMERGEIPLELDGERTRENLAEVIERWEQYYADAPGEDEHESAAREFQDKDYWSEIAGWAEVDGKKIHAVIENSQYLNKAVFWQEGYGDRNGTNGLYASFADEPWEIAISEEEALEMGTELMEKLGLDVVCDLIEPVVFSVNYSGIGYRMEFVRQVNGLPIAYSMYPGTAVEENSSGEEIWGYERISVYAAKAGIVYFSWENPHTGPVLETEDAKLMAFSDIHDIFGKMIMIKNQYLQNANEVNGFDTIRNVNVDKVQLSLMRVRDKGSFEQGLIIPVWDFYGSITAHTDDENYKQYVFEGPHYETLLTLNAIDGTLIDRELGY